MLPVCWICFLHHLWAQPAGAPDPSQHELYVQGMIKIQVLIITFNVSIFYIICIAYWSQN